MLDFRNPGLLLGLIVLVALVTPAAAFGAGNIASISKVEARTVGSRAPYPINHPACKADPSLAR